jgi:hypothetical protein
MAAHRLDDIVVDASKLLLQSLQQPCGALPQTRALLGVSRRRSAPVVSWQPASEPAMANRIHDSRPPLNLDSSHGSWCWGFFRDVEVGGVSQLGRFMSQVVAKNVSLGASVASVLKP